MSNIHICEPRLVETEVEENPKDLGIIKTRCCRAKRIHGEYKEVIEYYAWYGPTIYFICKNQCDEKSKRDGRRTATIYQPY